jgi:protein-tyrosine phosphatase
MPSVLFVCTANQFRSPIAAACFSKLIEREQGAKSWRVESAGTWANSGTRAPDIAVQVAESLGLPRLDRHLSRQIDRQLLEGFDLVIVMETGHKEAICIEFPSICQRTYLLSEIVDGISYDIPDPPNSASVTPDEAGTILFDLLARGKEKILKLAESFSRE